MPLQKQNVSLNFSQGLDTKSDPWQVALGKFLTLNNTVFQVGGRLTKRNGFLYLSSAPVTNNATYLTTLSNNLTAVGSAIYAYNQSSQSWIPKGNYQPLTLSVLPLIRNSVGQIQCDAVVAPNGLVCTVYTETSGISKIYKYAIADSATGQNIVAPTLIPVSSGVVTGSPRVFVLGNYFVIVFTNVISGTSHLQYIAISTNSPTIVTTNADIAAAYMPSPGLSWDGIVFNNSLYVAYYTSSGTAIQITSLSSTAASIGGAPGAATSFSGYQATLLSVCVDSTATNPSIYINSYNNTGTASTSTGYMFAVDVNLSSVMIPVPTIAGLSEFVSNLASAAQNGTCTLFYEVQNAYGYDANIPTNFVNKVSVTPSGAPVSFHSVFSSGAGTITASSATGLVNGMHLVDVTTVGNIALGTTFTISGTTLTLSANTAGNSASTPGDSLQAQTIAISSTSTIVRSVGLASKAFIVNGTIYFLSTYQSSAASGAGYQPTYFLINGSLSTQAAPIVVAKVAYGNGNGYLSTGLPGVTVTNNVAQIAYLFKDLIEAQAPAGLQSINLQAPQVYSQAGINLVAFTIGNVIIDSIEVAQCLQLSGGFGWMYDGYLPVEENFFLWPDSVEVTPGTGTVSLTGNVVAGTNVFTVSSSAGVGVGMTWSFTGSPVGHVIGVTPTSIIASFTFGSTTSITYDFTGAANAQPDGTTNTNAYYWQAIYDWTDNNGNIYHSSPSIPVSATTTGSGTDYSFTLNIPTLRLTYKTKNPAKIRVYRWSVANPVYYEVTSIQYPVMNDTTIDSVTFVDGWNDSLIVGNNIIYTTGGVLEDVNSPAADILTSFDTRAWKITSEDKNTAWYSKILIENVPVEWSDLQTLFIAPNIGTEAQAGPVLAAAPMDDKLVFFHGGVIDYINGTGPDATGTNSQYSQPTFITSTVGCSNQQSIVLMQNGLMFQASNGKGIWLLGRDLSTQYIGAPVERYNSDTVTSAVNVPSLNQVRFLLSSGLWLVYDYYYNQWGTFSGLGGLPTTSSCVFQNLHTFINTQGQVYQENPGSYLDGSDPVLMNFTTSWLQLSNLQGYQRSYFFFLLAQYLSPHKLDVGIAYNFNPSIAQSSLITPNNFSNPNPSPFGVPSPYGGPGQLEQWRVFLAQQRCQSFQITIQEIYDPSLGVAAGAGFAMSGINLIVGLKKGWRTIPNADSIGGGTNRG